MNNKKCYSEKLYHSIEGGESINFLTENDLLKSFEDLQTKLVELYRIERRLIFKSDSVAT